MRVAMYYNNRDVRLEEMPTPTIGPGELLVKVMASGICGSDVMEWYRLKKAPLVLGHEISGEIAEVGEGAGTYEKGDRVFVSHHVPCNTCPYCLSGHQTVCDTLRSTNFDPGGFAEYLRVAHINVDRGVFALPDDVSFEEGTFIEPLGCVVRGMRLVRFQPAWTVLVLGSGISGLLNISLARALGAGRVISTDISEYRLEAARRFGADLPLNAEEDIPSALRDENQGRLAELVIVSTGAPPAFTQALNCVDRGGTVLFFAPPEPGVQVNLSGWDFWRDQITLISTYAASPVDVETAIELIRARRVPVADMITHRLSLSETQLGFELVAKAQDSIKVIIEPHK